PDRRQKPGQIRRRSGSKRRKLGLRPSELAAGELRLVRRAGTFHGYVRPDNSEMWTEIGSGQAVPRSMPALVKFGVRLSAEAQKSAQVRWPWLTLRGAVVKRD